MDCSRLSDPSQRRYGYRNGYKRFHLFASLEYFIGNMPEGLKIFLMVFSDHPSDNASQLQICPGSDDGIFWIGSFQINLTVLLFEIFHGPFSIHFGDHNVSDHGCPSSFNNDEITFHNTLADHGIPTDFQQERRLSGLSFLIITIIPSIAIGELGVRGSVNLTVFALANIDASLILIATFSLWLINLAFPAFIGSFGFLFVKLRSIVKFTKE